MTADLLLNRTLHSPDGSRTMPELWHGHRPTGRRLKGLGLRNIIRASQMPSRYILCTLVQNKGKQWTLYAEEPTLSPVARREYTQTGRQRTSPSKI